VTLNLHNKSLSAAERAAATSHEQESQVRRVLAHMNGVRVYGDNRGRFENARRAHGPRFRVGITHSWSSDPDKEVANLLWKYHQKANAGFQAAKRELHGIKVQSDVREKLRDELRQRVRQELQGIVREEVRDEMREEMRRIKRELKDELREEMTAQMQAYGTGYRPAHLNGKYG
jgi:murein tripeptide amidase MpaA